MMEIRDILAHIKKRESEGASDLQIDNELMDMGATEEQIDEANDMYCDQYLKEVR